MSNLEMIALSGVVYRVKSTGPITECFQFLRIAVYFSNKNTIKFEPAQIFHTNLKVVNVAWSSKIRAVTSPWSILIIISLCNFSSADSVG